jgi:hypothetical protein
MVVELSLIFADLVNQKLPIGELKLKCHLRQSKRFSRPEASTGLCGQTYERARPIDGEIRLNRHSLPANTGINTLVAISS